MGPKMQTQTTKRFLAGALDPCRTLLCTKTCHLPVSALNNPAPMGSSMLMRQHLVLAFLNL